MYLMNAGAYPSPPDFATMLRDLARAEAFPPHNPRLERSADVSVPTQTVQTHASAVLLTNEYAYKLKKPYNFGFFDYSTPALRRRFCAREVRLNRTWAPGIYLGVAPVEQTEEGVLSFGKPCPPGQVPTPYSVHHGLRVIDYAVVMQRLPEEATLASLIRHDRVDSALLTTVAERVAAVHRTHPAVGERARYGHAQIIAANWDENFAQMRPYLERVLSADDNRRIRAYVRAFLTERAPLLASRSRARHICDCHGDLRAEHIYRLPSSDVAGDVDGFRLVFLDRVEFLDRFRYGDVAGEVAFLFMDLEAAGRADLARDFVAAYVRASGDEALPELLPFYACYRAYVRGKVLAFELDEPEVPADDREAAREHSQELFAQAARYAASPVRPRLILIGGVMGSGKSTLAEMLHAETGAVLLSSDVVRKSLAGVDEERPLPAAFGADIYNASWNERTYATLGAAARAALTRGRSAILDASFARRRWRAAAGVGASSGAEVIFIEASCPRDVALARLAHRWQAKLTSVLDDDSSTATAPSVSDGRPDLYDAQAATWEPLDAGEAAVRQMRVNTNTPLPTLREHLLAALGIPHIACWLDTHGNTRPRQAPQR